MDTSSTTQLLEDLEAGIFMQRLDAALRACAAGVVEYSRDGEITIKLKLKKIGDSSQVTAVHSIKSSHPTLKGKVVEEATTNTPLHVGRGGRLSLYPEAQGKLFEAPPANTVTAND